MKKILLTMLCATAILSGCAPAIRTSDNPLLKSQRGEELSDTLANLIISNDPIVKQPGMQTVINAEITKAKQVLADGHNDERSGMIGTLIPIKENAQGTVLYKNDTLYLSSDFYAQPGIELHLYLTTAVDPRDVAFPDKTALDLATLEYPYGAMSLQVPHQNAPELYRTAVLWDKKLNRLYGFAQLSKQK